MGGTRIDRQTENTNTKLTKKCMQELPKDEKKKVRPELINLGLCRRKN
jgi:hypothetical protein